MGSAVTIHVQCAYPSGSPSKMNLSPVFSGVHIFVFCRVLYVNHCLSFFLLAIMLSVLLLFTSSDYTFGTFKSFFDFPLLVPSNLSLISSYWYLQTFLWFPPIGTFKSFFDFPLLVPSNLSLISHYWYLQTFLWFPPIGTFKPFFDFPL
jgi:hypothetical protein